MALLRGSQGSGLLHTWSSGLWGLSHRLTVMTQLPKLGLPALSLLPEAGGRVPAQGRKPTSEFLDHPGPVPGLHDLAGVRVCVLTVVALPWKTGSPWRVLFPCTVV